LLVDPVPNGPVERWKRQLERDCTEASWTQTVVSEETDVPWPPPLARILRNTPYAMRGRVFSSPDLAEYFSKQVWYRPRPDAPTPPPAEVACAGRIADWEERRAREEQLDPALEARLVHDGVVDLLMRDPDAWRDWPRSGAPFERDGAIWWC